MHFEFQPVIVQPINVQEEEKKLLKRKKRLYIKLYFDLSYVEDLMLAPDYLLSHIEWMNAAAKRESIISQMNHLENNGLRDWAQSKLEKMYTF